MNITDHNYSLKTAAIIGESGEAKLCKKPDQSSLSDDFITTNHQTLNPDIGETPRFRNLNR